MTGIKIDSKLTASGSDALADHARPLYDRLGSSRMGIVELKAIERTTPAPGEDKSPGVKLRIVGLEVANHEQEGAVREAQRALFLQRTAYGTLSEEGELELSKETMRETGGLLHAIETARLKAALLHWATEARKVVNGASKITDSEIRHELDRIAEGLSAALHPARGDGDE